MWLISVQLQVSSMVPTVGAVLISCSLSYQTPLQTVPCLLTEKLENDPCVSLSYQTTQGQNIPWEPTRIQIRANSTPKQTKGLGILSFQRSSFTCSSLLVSSLTHKRFLHACTPERRTRAFAHL